MFAKYFVPFLAVSAIAVSASPVRRDESSLARRYDWPSFNDYSPSLSGFDDFYGCDNFGHSSFTQTVVEQQNQVVCHSQSVVIIQQRLAVLQEMAKRIITEQVCDVESQVVVFEQFHASLGGFSRDLRRYSPYQVGYDHAIAGHYGDIVGSDGSLSSNDFGFHGSDIGSNTIVVGGNNWVDGSSQISVGHAYDQAKSAYVSFD
jgi:hypothetical protein